MKKPTMLIILDGLGLGDNYEGNAFYLAKTNTLDMLLRDYPNSSLEASGLAVGLPMGQMGNSEVGHLNIGAGRVIYQDLTKISKEIEDGEFFIKKELIDGINNAKNSGKKIHLMGLVSPGGVHSHNTHLYALLKMIKDMDYDKVYIHAILDGRDVPPDSGLGDLKDLQAKIDEIGVGQISSVSGRYYAMDRDKRWDRTEKAYKAYTEGLGIIAQSPIEAVKESYEQGVYDEFVLPTVISGPQGPSLVETGDTVIFFNFRPDRARQITRAFVDENFLGFERSKKVSSYFITMTEYDKTIENLHVVYKNQQPNNTLGEYISNHGLRQLRAAETEKYGHVTFFFNGGKEDPFINEDRVLIPSPKVATYDLKPEMSAIELKDEIIRRLDMDKYDLIILNFANPDMVGHTGKIEPAIRAVETVDKALGEILEKLEEKSGRALITADHGNVELLLDKETRSPITSHTSNKVPLILYGEKDLDLKDGILADLAPTILDLLGLEKPEEMTGESLIIRKPIMEGI